MQNGDSRDAGVTQNETRKRRRQENSVIQKRRYSPPEMQNKHGSICASQKSTQKRNGRNGGAESRPGKQRIYMVPGAGRLIYGRNL